MKQRNKWILILCLVAGLCSWGYYEATKAHNEFLETKAVHDTTATVIGKKDFLVDKNKPSSATKDSDSAHDTASEKRNLVYYQIDNFDQILEPRRSRVIESEKRLIEASGPRYVLDVAWFDEVKLGDKIRVSYQSFSDGHIQVWGAGKVREEITN